MDTGIDDLDRQLIHALAIDGRAPFGSIAEVLGVSERTISRRYARLRSAGAISVVAATTAQTVGAVEWFLRVRCAPSTAVPVADALARRADTSWVMLTSGGTEIVCAVYAEEETDSEALLLGKLPRTPRVEAVTAHSVLHTFYGFSQSPIAKIGPLSATATARLRPQQPPAAQGPVRLTEGERALIAALSVDPRASYEQLATATGWSASTARRRLGDLQRRGVLYFDLDVHPGLFGHSVRTLLWLSVSPARLRDVGRALARHPEVAFAAATTGATNVCATVLCSSQSALYEYMIDKLAGLPGITHIETAPVIKTLKEATSRMGLPTPGSPTPRP